VRSRIRYPWLLLAAAVGSVALFAGGGSAAGAGSNLVPNPSFESGGSYSFAGWGMTSATNSAASDAESGSWAARIQPNGSVSSYGIYVKPQPVGSATAGSQYVGSAWIRSDKPGKTVCVNLRDVAGNGSLAQPLVKRCAATGSSWSQLTTPTLTVKNSGDAVGFTVTQAAAASTDSFEVDDVALVASGSAPTDSTAPSTPANLQATQVTASSVTLAWDASTDPDDASSTLTYRVSRGSTVVGTTAAGVTTFTDSGLSAGQQYSYTVVALDPAGNASPATTPLQVTTTTAQDTTAPTVPTGVTATASGTTTITVSWTASTDPDDASSSLTYDVYRYSSLIGTVPGTSALTFTDSSLQSGTSASYDVVARDPAGNQSAPSKTVWATTASAPTTVASWNMDEPAGSTTMLDSSPNQNDGTLTNVVAGAPGFTGTGYSFTPKAYVTVPSSASLNPDYRNVTVTLHLLTTSLPTSGDFDLLRKGKSPNDVEYKVELLQSGQILCALHGLVGGTTFTGVGVQSTGSSLADGNWHTITCARTDYRTVTLTVDGTQYSASLSGASLGAISPTLDLYIGANGLVGDDYYRGTLDDVTVQVG
jgi:chitodextrinase